jgi:hypothetical protein
MEQVSIYVPNQMFFVAKAHPSARVTVDASVIHVEVAFHVLFPPHAPSDAHHDAPLCPPMRITSISTGRAEHELTMHHKLLLGYFVWQGVHNDVY